MEAIYRARMAAHGDRSHKALLDQAIATMRQTWHGRVVGLSRGHTARVCSEVPEPCRRSSEVSGIAARTVSSEFAARIDSCDGINSRGVIQQVR